MASSTYDVCVWGANGVTGSLVAEYLARKKANFAIAGRNKAKLEKVKQDVMKSSGVHVDILIATLDDSQSLDRMCQSTKVILSTVGPYLKYGMPIAEACVRNGRDYVDISGEVPFVRRLIDNLDEKAQKNNSVLVPMCGFDSIPSDLGAYVTVSQIKKKFGCKTRRVVSYVAARGKPSGGTLATGILMDKKYPKESSNVFLLGGERKGGVREEDLDFKTVEFSREVGAWTAPFGMAKLNTRVVRRSCELFEKIGDGYGSEFSYNERALAPNQKVAKKISRAASIPYYVLEKMIAAGRLPKQGEGPSADERKKNWFAFKIIGEGTDGRKILTKIKGKDPGYDETAKMVSEAALLLAEKKEQLLSLRNRKGGVLTPAFAFGQALVGRLHAAGITFSSKTIGTENKNQSQSSVSIPAKL